MRIHKLTDLPWQLQADISEMGEMRAGLTCPECEGGQSKEQSLSVWRDKPFIILKCWRDGCGYLARVPVDDGWEDAKIGQHMFKPRVYKGNLCALNTGLLKWLDTVYRIRPDTALAFNLKRVMGRRALYFPVLGPHYEERGGVLRYYDGSQPKAVSYKASAQPWQAWFLPDDIARSNRITAVIVEDVLSALRCHQLGYVSIALLGTNLSLEKEREIFREVYGPVRLALDKDAFQRALRYARRNSRIVPVLLDRDIKDISDDEIRERIDG